MAEGKAGGRLINQGTALCAIGTGIMGLAYFGFETSIRMPSGEMVSNLSLMQQQLMIFHAGIALLIIGALTVVAGLAIVAIGPEEE